jgi:superfamily II DNA or RNA helicase
MQGDHIVPWADGGPTVPENLQALCGSCNLRKGRQLQHVIDAYFDVHSIAPGTGELREWQREALSVVIRAITREPVLVEACPGAGKTRFGLEVVYRLVMEGIISRVLIVVPTIGIADAWHRAASVDSRYAPTMPLRNQRDWRTVNPIGDQWLGAIITYQSLFASTEMFLAHATDPGHRTLVVFDEVHHAGAGAAWGISAQTAFSSGARAILSLTGTPFRTKQDPIVFVPSEDGAAKPHYRYSYDRAIRDGVCRPVQFVETRGKAAFRDKAGCTFTVTFDDELSTAGERQRLRAALEWIDVGSIAEKMLVDANRYIIALRRQGDTDAAGLVVCADCRHAAAVARYMDRHVIGRRPAVAFSRFYDENDPKPANAIRQFVDSHDPWLVAVNMVSEGVDIPRLRVVVYLTNKLTLLAFRQIVGRVVRTETSNVDDHGRVYLPGEPQLLEMARNVTDEVDLLPPPLVIFTDGTPGQFSLLGDGKDDLSALEVLGTSGDQGDVFDTGGRVAHAVLVACARIFIEREGLTATDAESLALAAAEKPELRDVLLSLREDR